MEDLDPITKFLEVVGTDVTETYQWVFSDGCKIERITNGVDKFLRITYLNPEPEVLKRIAFFDTAKKEDGIIPIICKQITDKHAIFICKNVDMSLKDYMSKTGNFTKKQEEIIIKTINNAITFTKSKGFSFHNPLPAGIICSGEDVYITGITSGTPTEAKVVDNLFELKCRLQLSRGEKPKSLIVPESYVDWVSHLRQEYPVKLEKETKSLPIKATHFIQETYMRPRSTKPQTLSAPAKITHNIYHSTSKNPNLQQAEKERISQIEQEKMSEELRKSNEEYKIKQAQKRAFSLGLVVMFGIGLATFICIKLTSMQENMLELQIQQQQQQNIILLQKAELEAKK